MDDNGIIDLFWQRSEDALTMCKDRFGGYCRTIACNILENDGDADECVNDEVFFGEFEDVQETAADTFYSHKDRGQAHLNVTMNDGTKLELRLFEGGYVGYQHLGWYFVKIPGAAFDTVFTASMTA